jgi:acyl phosphate:glycerol-3-phosphate acyltransferase
MALGLLADDRRPPALAVLAGSFLAGAVPFSFIAARALRGVDLREHGAGTVSATGVGQVAGTVPLVLAGLLDVAKGAIGPRLAGPGRPGLAALAAAAAVTGHNWSPFLRGAGGRGVSVAVGALAATEPAGAGVLLIGLGVGRLARQTGLGCLVACLALPAVLRRADGGRGAAVAWATVLPMLAKRLAGNEPARSPQVYLARLLFDRDQLAGAPGGGR